MLTWVTWNATYDYYDFGDLAIHERIILHVKWISKTQIENTDVKCVELFKGRVQGQAFINIIINLQDW